MVFENLFAGYELRKDRLKPYGFEQTETGYRYEQALLEGDLVLQLSLDQAGHAGVQVWDSAMDLPYLGLTGQTRGNAYAQQVQEACESILLDIRQACFDQRYLSSPQGQRLLAYMQASWADPFDHPFQRTPDALAFRYADSGKWYALCMEIPGEKLEASRTDSVLIVNLKAQPDQIATLTQTEGIFPAYHMNKKHWITVTLDDRLDDQTLFDLLADSRALVAGKSPHA